MEQMEVLPWCRDRAAPSILLRRPVRCASLPIPLLRPHWSANGPAHWWLPQSHHPLGLQILHLPLPILRQLELCHLAHVIDGGCQLL